MARLMTLKSVRSFSCWFGIYCLGAAQATTITQADLGEFAFENFTTAVPEASTWAMMILGFVAWPHGLSPQEQDGAERRPINRLFGVQAIRAFIVVGARSAGVRTTRRSYFD